MNKILMKLNSSVLLYGRKYKELNKGEVVELVALNKNDSCHSKIEATVNTNLYGNVKVCFSLLEPLT